MLLALNALDFGLLGLFLLSILAVGAYFLHQQRTVTDFLVGGRSLLWTVAGCSAAVTLLAAHQFVTVPGEAYDVGLKWWLAPIGVCLAAPVVLALLPLFSRLDISSIYEYLELRFGPAVRWAAAGAWVVWRLLWLAVVLGVPCRLIALACSGVPPAWLWIVIVGLVATLTACLGGMKAVAFTDVLQLLAMLVAVLVVVVAVWLSLDEGSAAVWNVAEQFDRTRVADLTFSWSDQWSFFNVLPFFALLMLVLSIADQTVVQRLIATSNTRHCRRSYVLGTGFLALLLAALAYAGIGLFAFYHQHPNDLRPVWVVNLDNQTRQSLTFADRDRLLAEQADVDGEGDRPRPAVEPPGGADRSEPLVDWNANLNDFDTLQQLVEEQRILRPNSKRPFEDVDELLNLETDELIVDRLAMKKPDGELVLHARAGLELLPHFLSQRLGMGLLGLVLAGILAASMAAFDSGVHSLATVLLVDFHRRGGIGRGLLARRLGKSPDQLTETDELKLARPLTAVAGLLAVILGLTLGQGLSAVWVLHAATLIIGTTLLTVFLLGILTRRTTGAGMLAGMVAGALLIGWLVFSPAATHDGGGSAAAWPRGGLSASWVMILGAAATTLVSLVVSLFAGSRRSRQELRGLVVGIGQLGEREIVHESISIPGGEDTPGKESRWRD